jgi:hypothetical protein
LLKHFYIAGYETPQIGTSVCVHFFRTEFAYLRTFFPHGMYAEEKRAFVLILSVGFINALKHPEDRCICSTQLLRWICDFCRTTNCQTKKCRTTNCQTKKCQTKKCRTTNCRTKKCRTTNCQTKKCRTTKCRQKTQFHTDSIPIYIQNYASTTFFTFFRRVAHQPHRSAIV